MKKMFLLAGLLLSVTFINAQLNFGIKAGYNSSLSLGNISSVTSGDYDLTDVKSELNNGFHAGIWARIGNKFYVQPELLYAMGKKEYTVTLQDAMNNDITYDKFVNISTVDIPLLVGYKLLDKKMANLRVFAGPKLRLDAGSSLRFDNVVSGGTITKEDLIADVKKSQIGLEIGAGVDVLMFTLDARYNLIGDMYQTKISDLNIDKMPVSTFVISLGWKIF